MELQQIYNATYNYFSEDNYWPQLVDYDKRWEISNDEDIKNAFLKDRSEGLMHYLKTKTSVESTYEMIQEMIQKLSFKEETPNRIR